MINITLLNIFFTLLFPSDPPLQRGGICNVFGNIYIETQSRNRADFTVYINNEDTFSDLKVCIQENQFYADKPGLWHFVKDRHLADHIIYIEQEKGLAKYKIFYTKNDFEAGCR